MNPSEHPIEGIPEHQEPYRINIISHAFERKAHGDPGTVKSPQKIIINPLEKSSFPKALSLVILGRAHTESTRHESTRSPLPSTPCDHRSVSRALGYPCYRTHWVDSFRATPIDSNDAVTKCNMLHFSCDMWPFCKPDHVSKIAIHTAVGGWECSFL